MKAYPTVHAPVFGNVGQVGQLVGSPFQLDKGLDNIRTFVPK